MRPRYCPDDGTETETTGDRWVQRGQCPECGDVWTAGLPDALLLRLPPTVRRAVMAVLETLFARPTINQRSAWLRGGVVAFFTITALEFVGYGGAGAVLGAVLFGLGLSVSGRFAGVHESIDGDFWSPPEGKDGPEVTPLDAVLVGGAVTLHGWLYGLPIDPSASGAPPSPDAGGISTIVPEATPFIMFVVTFHLAMQVGIVLHELLHYGTIRVFGHDARINLYWLKVGRLRLGFSGGRVVPVPYYWDPPIWKQTAVSLAPLVLLAPLAAYLTLVGGLPGTPLTAGRAAHLGLLAAWVVAALPSPGDLGVAGWGFTERWQAVRNSAENHATAEGIEANPMTVSTSPSTTADAGCTHSVRSKRTALFPPAYSPWRDPTEDSRMTLTALLGATSAAFLVGGAHYIAHDQFGADEETIQDAGAMQAGVAVMIATFAVVFFILY